MNRWATDVTGLALRLFNLSESPPPMRPSNVIALLISPSIISTVLQVFASQRVARGMRLLGLFLTM
jgi:hypothetical protein